MKLTAKNLLENWDNVKGQLSDRIVKAYEAGVPDALPYYDDPEFAEIVDMFLKDANEELAEAEKKADKKSKPKTITAEERKRRAQKIKEHRKDRNKKSETPAENKAKETKPQPKTEKADTKTEAKKPKSAKKTANTPHKDSYARPPYWYKILDGFCGLAGKNKETWRIQNYLDYIQDSCAEERNRKTPYIELIRKIQDAILKYANVDRKEKPKQTLPAWADLVSDCKAAMKSITISTKTGASPFWSKAGLAGIDIIKWYVAFMDTRGFKNLDDAKKFVRNLSKSDKKYLVHEKSYIYRATNNKMDRTVDFTVQKDGKVRFRKIAAA